MKKDVLTISVLIVIIMGLSIFSFFSYKKQSEYMEKNKKIVSENREIKKENSMLKAKVKATGDKREEKVKFDTEEFLQAFFTYDTSKAERGWTKIKPFVTENARKMVAPAGENPDNVSKTEVDKTIISKLDTAQIYYTPVDDMKSNVFARVWYNMTVNGITSKTQILLDLQLIYDSNKDRWIVDDIKIQQELNDKGYTR
ncbi:hypothetical protein [Bacillus pseudomycoides]|uniref:hypothetical protein n=1 Tax=Bacillus pseudomycoides TaxID=64104 RepID=UPI003CE95788